MPAAKIAGSRFSLGWEPRNNRAADLYVERAIRDDPSIYPSAAMRARLYQQAEAGPQTERIRTRTWTTVKTGT